MSRSALADFLPIATLLFIAVIGMGMMVPILPSLIPPGPTSAGAGGAASAGLLLSMLGVARLLANVPAGLLVDRAGVRPTMIVGLVMLAAGGFLAGAAPGFALLLLAILLQGMGGAFYAAAAITAFVERAGPARRGTAMGWFQGTMLAALSLGPPVGGVIAAHITPRAPFLVQGALALLALVAVMLARPVGAARAPARAPWRALLGSVPVLSACLMGFAAFFARTAAGWSLVPLIGPQRFAMDAGQVGLVLGLGTAANFVVVPVVAHATDRWGARLAVLAATALTLAAILVLALVPAAWGLWVGTVLVMVGTGAMLPAAGALALERAAGVGTGAVTALIRTLGDVGIALGPVGSTTIASLAGLPITGGLWVTGGVVAASAAVFVAAQARATRA
jgi:DHA1 family multidrug resistance protein-like MFS transporter